jgi:hypothetical protein
MQVRTFTQEQAKGFFAANTDQMVIEFFLSDTKEVLEVTGSRGIPISNSSAIKRLDQLSNPQKYEFDNYDSRKKEKRCGFTRWIPEGKEQDVMLRITTCGSVKVAKVVSEYLRATVLPKNRAMRRDVKVAGVKGMRIVNLKSDVIVDAGTSTNVALKVA